MTSSVLSPTQDEITNPTPMESPGSMDPHSTPSQDLVEPTDSGDSEEDPVETPGLSPELWAELSEISERSDHIPHWSAIDMVRGVMAYSMYGNSLAASRHCGVPSRTLRDWKNTVWFKRVLYECHKLHNDQVVSKLTRTMLAATDALEDRVKNGEYVYDKEGNMLLDEKGLPKRKKLTAHSLAIDGLAIPNDKRALMIGDPTSRTDGSSAAQMLTQLKDLFLAVGQRDVKNITPEKALIEHQ